MGKLQGTEKAAGSMSRYPKASQHQRDPMRGLQRSASPRRSSASAGAAPRVAHVHPLVGPAVPLTLLQQLLHHQDRLKGQQQAQEQVLQDHAQQVLALFPQEKWDSFPTSSHL